MKYSKVIAIDGPSGSGKSTIAKMVAKKLGHIYIDTGAMFRAIGLHLSKKNIIESDLDKIVNELCSLKFDYGESDTSLVVLNGVNLTGDIRQHYVSDIASKYSKISCIRDYLRDFQRGLATTKGCVMEGRDIGTVIFPNAYLKVFLTASDHIRALRRQKQLEQKGEYVGTETILRDIMERDERDSKRELAPLVKASDAIELLTDNYEIDEVIDKIMQFESLYNERLER